MNYKELAKLNSNNPDEPQIYALVGDDGVIRLTCSAGSPEFMEWVAEGNTPEPADTVDPWEAIREKRNELIRESDWTMIPGCTVDQAQWAAYRQTLRDIPSTYAETGPESVVWPRKPSTSGPNTIDE